MDAFVNMTTGTMGWATWLIWMMIGIAGTAMIRRLSAGAMPFSFLVVIGIVAALIGGVTCARTFGDTPMQAFLISMLGAAFFALAALWIVMAIFRHFSKK